MLLKLKLILFLISFLSITACKFFLDTQVGSIRLNYYDSVAKGDFESASILFHYHKSLEGKDLSREVRRISTAIKSVTAELEIF